MRYDARQNRERILVAAEAVFGRQGSAGSTEEVARRAGVGIGTVFRHFPTKQALVEAAVVRHFEELTAHARELADQAEPADALRTLVRLMIETGGTKITLVTSVGVPSEIPAGIVEASEQLRAAVDAVLQRARGAGQVRGEVTVDEVYLLVRGLAQASVTMPTVSAPTLSRAVDIVLAGLTGPDRSPPE